jgi:hypothetical protein
MAQSNTVHESLVAVLREHVDLCANGGLMEHIGIHYDFLVTREN